MKVFVDTSALYALLDRDEGRHLEATATLGWLRTGAQLVTHNYIHVESLALVGRRLGREATVALVDDLLPVIETMWVDEGTHGRGLAAVRAGRGTAGLVDEVSFTIMRDAGIGTAFAYDDDFVRQGFRLASAETKGDPPRLSETLAPYGSATDAAPDREPPVDDLVSVAEIGQRSGRSVNTVQSWRRRHATFPSPAADLAAGPIWRWRDVASWIAKRAQPRAVSIGDGPTRSSRSSACRPLV